MKKATYLTVLSILMAVCGCASIFKAREAQERYAERSDEVTPPQEKPKVDLRGYSLEQMVAFALTNRPSVVSARLSVEDARLRLKQLAADAPLVSDTPWTAPKLSARVGHSESSETAKFQDLKLDTDGSMSGSLSLELLVWDFGRYSAEAKSASEEVIASELELVRVGYEVFEEVSEAYFTVLKRDALFEVALTNEYEYALHLERAQEMFESGENKQIDVLRARLDLSKAKEGTVAASNDMVTAGAELMRALGIEAGKGSISDVLPEGSHALAFAHGCFSETAYTAEDALEAAIVNAPIMKERRARLRAASANVDYAIADLMPSVSASASLNFTDPLWVWNWGVSAVQTIFQGFRKTTAIDRAVVALENAATEVDIAEQNISLSLELAIAERDNARFALETAEVSVKQGRENLDLVNEQYRLGDVSRVDFTDSIGDYTDSLGNRISAFYRGQIAEAKLFSILGKEPKYAEEAK